MNRREFVSGMTAGTLMGLSGCLSGSSLGNTIPEIDVKLFQTDKIARQTSTFVDDNYILDQSKDLIENSFETLSFDIDVNVKISNSRISESAFSEVEDPLDAWSDIVEDRLSDDEKSDHCNLIFMDRNVQGSAGRAEMPCGCGKPRSSAIFNASSLHYVRPEEISTDEPRRTDGQRYPVVVHEVGHQIGLTHDMGSVVSKNSSNKRVVTSAMLGRYVMDLKDNYKNESRFSEYDSSWTVYQMGSFSSQISESDLRQVFNY